MSICKRAWDKHHICWLSKPALGIILWQRNSLLLERGEKAFQFIHQKFRAQQRYHFWFSWKDNQLWIATDGGGINILDFQTMKFSHLKHISDDEQSLPNNSIYRLYKDQMDNIWIGSIHGGLFAIKKCSSKPIKMFHWTIPMELANVPWLASLKIRIHCSGLEQTEEVSTHLTKNEYISSLPYYIRGESYLYHKFFWKWALIIMF